MVKADKFLWKRKHFEERSWKRKQTRKHLTFWEAGSGREAEAFFIKHGTGIWKRKHFEERSWKREQTRKRLTLYGVGSGSKKYSTASTSLVSENKISCVLPVFDH